MAQLRIDDYGDPVISDHQNWPRQYVLAPGVYSGFDLSADTSFNLEIAAGVGLQPDGVLWQEDDTTTLTFTTPGVATNYTVYATHVNRNITDGVPVEYDMQTGITDTITDGVVLGWIYYTSGTLTDAMLVSAPKLRPDLYTEAKVEAAPLQLFAPFPRMYSDVTGMGANLTFTGQTAADLNFDTTYFVNHQRVTKLAGPAGAETLTQHLQFTMGNWRPQGFDFYCNVQGPSAALQLELRDTDLNITTITGSPINGSTTNWEWRSIEVDRIAGTFAANKPYELRVTSAAGVGERVDLAIVIARFWPYAT